MTINTVTPFTSSPGTLNGEAIPAGWMAQHELAEEIVAADDRLTVRDWNTLLSAIDKGLPVVLTTHERIGDRTVQRKTTLIVKYAIVFPRSDADPTAGSANRIRVNYWGFGHYIWLGEIDAVDTPDVEYI